MKKMDELPTILKQVYIDYVKLDKEEKEAKAKKARKKKHLIFVAIAITGNLAFIGFTLYGSIQLANIPPMTGQLLKGKPEILTEYREFLNPEHDDLKEHSKITKIMASSFFEDNGVIVEVVEENGELVEYKPSPENLKVRQEMLQADALIQHQAKAMKSSGNIHAMLLISAIFIGFISPWVSRKSYISGRRSCPISNRASAPRLTSDLICSSSISGL